MVGGHIRSTFALLLPNICITHMLPAKAFNVGFPDFYVPHKKGFTARLDPGPSPVAMSHLLGSTAKRAMFAAKTGQKRAVFACFGALSLRGGFGLIGGP